ncbi:hypothetical protein Salat_2082000 [Sesamum alatum]|uniref:B box-type domain-containing protein n=1 Tax=Sesamum alatum TaxID=300844 RepID=A0AAE1Y086_9LAMI|nr:hypothetical protein Salat_2082000 [Sesamum alatum]
MVMSSEANPKWLDSWLDLPFYGGAKCGTHIHKYKTIFCAVCMESAVCETCWKYHHSKNHHGHVCSCTGRAAVDIKEIKKYMDASGIQLYKINGKDIVFLNPHWDGAQDHHGHDPKCQICKRRIKDSNYLYCSITCKARWVVVGAFIPTVKEQAMRSMRKRSRKGIPRRAPVS